jgi:GNAT superfamily N-acetyltransferase
MKNGDEIFLGVEDPGSNAAAQLMRELSAEILQRYHDYDNLGAGILNPDEVRLPRSVFILATLNAQPVGCGALCPLNVGTVEVRRIYVAPSARRRGVARRLLVELERRVEAFGYDLMRLETGFRQPEAIALYEAAGFYRIPPFGKYIGDPVSVCFEKCLRPIALDIPAA